MLDHRKNKGIKKKQKKPSTSASLTSLMLKPLTVCITTNCGKFLKRWECQATLPALRNPYAREEQKLEPEMEQLTG